MSTHSVHNRVPRDTDRPNSMYPSPLKIGSRRVLGELPPNARTSPSKSNIRSEQPGSLKSPSPLKRVHAMSSAQFQSSVKRPGPPPAKASRKRAIHEVDTPTVHDTRHRVSPFTAQAHLMYGPHIPAQEAYIPREDPSSPAQSNVVGLPDDDELPVPYVEGRAASMKPSGPSFSQESLAKMSFSSLIDYDAAESLPKDPAKARLKQQVDTLRLRLRLASYKVQTEQTRVPLSQLQVVPQPKKRNVSSEALPGRPQPQSQNTKPKAPAPDITASGFVKETAAPSSSPQDATSLPSKDSTSITSETMPTTSATTIDPSLSSTSLATTSCSQESFTALPHIPSSPPPLLPAPEPLAPARRTGSPADSVQADKSVRRERGPGGDTTGSDGEGKTATGSLDLVNAESWSEL